MSLNTIPLETALRELHEDQDQGDLARLKAFYEMEDFEPQARRCSSIITRGEAQLFNASIPRFATRVYLQNNLGFVNCRRLATFLTQTHHDGIKEWGKRRDQIPDGTSRNSNLERQQLDNIPLRDIVNGASCIADSLLAPPLSLEPFAFTYLPISLTQLPKAYCELGGALVPGKTYLPYLKSVNLGGGMCSQAVSFIATVALIKHVRAVGGILEITALAHPPDTVELSISGLTPQMMKLYFQEINLRLTEQQPPSRDQVHLATSSKAYVSSAIQAYLKSGFPVIAPVDQFRMAFGTDSGLSPIYSDNGLEAAPIQAFSAPHAVILVGCGNRDGEDCFVFHDPAVMPYLVATLDQLCEVGAIDPDATQPDNGVFMPVTPAPVIVPLLRERHYLNEAAGQRRQTTPGLFTLARLLHATFRADELPIPQGQFLGEFRLTRIADPIRIPEIVSPALRHRLEAELPRILRATCELYDFGQDHWFWLEFFPESLWLWDAEDALPEVLPAGPGSAENAFALASRFLTRVVSLHGNHLSVTPEIQTHHDPNANA